MPGPVDHQPSSGEQRRVSNAAAVEVRGEGDRSWHGLAATSRSASKLGGVSMAQMGRSAGVIIACIISSEAGMRPVPLQGIWSAACAVRCSARAAGVAPGAIPAVLELPTQWTTPCHQGVAEHAAALAHQHWLRDRYRLVRRARSALTLSLRVDHPRRHRFLRRWPLDGSSYPPQRIARADGVGCRPPGNGLRRAPLGEDIKPRAAFYRYTEDPPVGLETWVEGSSLYGRITNRHRGIGCAGYGVLSTDLRERKSRPTCAGGLYRGRRLDGAGGMAGGNGQASLVSANGLSWQPVWPLSAHVAGSVLQICTRRRRSRLRSPTKGQDNRYVFSG